jgi:hypothetical protein
LLFILNMVGLPTVNFEPSSREDSSPNVIAFWIVGHFFG